MPQEGNITRCQASRRATHRSVSCSLRYYGPFASLAFLIPCRMPKATTAAFPNQPQEVEVGAFLSSRGWRVAFCAEATPLLWRAAEESGLLEVGGDPVQLQRRWPFQPSKLLLQQAPLLEELLVRSWAQQQLAPQRRTAAAGQEGQVQEPPHDEVAGGGAAGQQQQAEKPGQSCRTAPGLPRAPKLTLRMLDVGCGSGRDLAWLSTRRSTVTVTVPAAEPLAEEPSSANAAAAAAEGSGSGSGASAVEPSGREVEVEVAWECVGLDSWHGALQRAAEVLDLGAVPTGPGGVTLHLVQIGGSAGAAAAAGGASTVDAATGAAPGPTSGASGCPLRPLPLPGTGPGGGSDGGGGGDGGGGAKGPPAKKAKKGTGGKGAELLLRYLAGRSGTDRICNGGGDGAAAATGATAVSALARPAVPVVPATAQPSLPPAPIPPGLGPDIAPGAEPAAVPAAAAPPDMSAAAAAAPSSSPPPPDLGGAFDLILCVRFLERSFLSHLPRLLRPGGVLLYSTFVDGPGLRAFGRPSGREHVLQRDELAGSMFGPGQGFQVLRDDIDLTADGREVSMFAARKLDAAAEAVDAENGEEAKEPPAAAVAGAEPAAVEAAEPKAQAAAVGPSAT